MGTKKLTHDLTHTTDTGIVYESTTGPQSQHEIIFDDKKKMWSWKGISCPFLNPLLSRETLTHTMNEYIVAMESHDPNEKKYHGTNNCSFHTYMRIMTPLCVCCIQT